MKILIVDDDVKRASSLREYLSLNCSIPAEEFFFAGYLAEARDLLRNVYFDALILDVVLPKRKDKKCPHHLVGIGLLEELNRNSSLKKPEKIIGITAHIEDIGQFRKEFEQSCNIVVEAPSNSDVWKTKISIALSYTGVSKTTRAAVISKTAVISVHGIRTFGQWQARLRRLIELRTNTVSFHTYKFGYFSSFLFLLPWARNLQVEHLSKNIQPIICDTELDRAYIFCHSFGTYLVAHSLLQLFDAHNINAKITLVLCGSVLSSNFEWRRINNGKGLRVVNDCGSRDYVLWSSAALVLGVGMAGKVGFYGFNNDFIMNRFFDGGHSSYFHGDGFMEKYWLPLLDEVAVISEVDERKYVSFGTRIAEHGVEFLMAVKPWIYVLFGLGLIAVTARGLMAG